MLHNNCIMSSSLWQELHLRRYRKNGFTIVELLIVVVVIAILAAITIVAFTGIQQRARNSGISVSLKDSVKLLSLYRSEKGSWPIEASGKQRYSYCIGRDFPVLTGSPSSSSSPTVTNPLRGCNDYNGSLVNEATWLSDILKPYGSLPSANSLLPVQTSVAVAPVYTTVPSTYPPVLCGVAGFVYPSAAPQNSGQSCTRYYITYGLSGTVSDCGGLQYAQNLGQYGGWTRCIILLEAYE